MDTQQKTRHKGAKTAKGSPKKQQKKANFANSEKLKKNRKSAKKVCGRPCPHFISGGLGPESAIPTDECSQIAQKFRHCNEAMTSGTNLLSNGGYAVSEIKCYDMILPQHTAVSTHDAHVSSPFITQQCWTPVERISPALQNCPSIVLLIGETYYGLFG